MSDFSLGNIEAQFIKKLLENPQDFAAVTENSITPEFFAGSTKRMFKYILDFKKKYAEIPSVDVFSKHFPNSNEILAVELTDAPIKWYCDRMRDKNIHNTLADGIEKAIEHLGEQEIAEASKALWENLLKANRTFIVKDTVKISDDPMKLYDEYLAEMGKDNSITGLPTGIDAFDYISGGIHPTDLQMIMGFTNSGKSWMQCIIADNLSRAGYHPLLITREMTPDALRKRIDAVHNRFPYSLFKKRQLTPKMLEQYKRYLEDLRDNPRQLTIEKSTGGVDEIAAMLDLHKPDVVLVDGAYLLAEDGDENKWMSIVNVWRGMKTLALSYKIPFIATMQLKSQKATLDNIPFAKYIAMDCDVIWGMEQSEEDKAHKALQIKSLKQRDSENIGKFVINWDFTEMNWSLIDHQIPGFNEWIVKRNSQKVNVEKETAEEEPKKKLKFKRGK